MAISEQAGDLNRALMFVHQGIALDPTSPAAYLAAYRMLDALGRGGEALEYLGKACQVSSEMAPCVAYAIDLFRVGKEARARDVFASSASLPESQAGVYNMACFRALTGEHQEAIRLLRRSLELGPPCCDIMEDEDLTSLHGLPEFTAVVEEFKGRMPLNHPK